MKKILTTIMMIAALSVSSLTAHAADFSGTIGLSTDYFWRGISQNNHSLAPSIDLAVEHEGWYVGTWASPVDFGTETDYEYDLYGGYDKQLTDKLLVGGGFLQYNYDSGLDKVTEYYVGGQYAGLVEVWYYVNNDNSDETYLDMSLKVPYISVVDLHVNYGKHKDGESVKGITVSKNVADDLVLSLMVLDEARHGKFMDSAALAIHYNF